MPPAAFFIRRRRAHGIYATASACVCSTIGSVGLVLKVSDEVQPGNVLVPGQRPERETVSGTINMLCSDLYTDIGEGSTYQSTWLNVTAWPRD